MKKKFSLSTITNLKQSYKNLFIATMLLLAGCNGSDSSTNSSMSNDSAENNTDSVALLAINSQELTVFKQPATIDLQSLVKVSDNSGFQLIDVKQKTGHCQITQQKQSITAVSAQIDDCIVEYKVQSLTAPQVQASAMVRVAVNSTYSDPVLPIITSDAEVGVPIEINLRDHLLSLGQDVGESVLSDGLVIIGNGTASKVAIDTITFTANQKGVTQLYYSYQNESSLWQGTLVFSVSDSSANKAPIAQNYVSPQELELGQQVTVDIKALDLISDTDNDNLQLIQVDGADSQLALLNPMDVDNTQFTFSSLTPGQHSVLYVVSDHQGGFTSAVILFNVKLDFSMLQPWDDIIIPAAESPWSVETTFIAPPSKELLDFNGINYTNSFVGDGINAPDNANIAQLTFGQARNYCVQRGGRLPTHQELELLNNYLATQAGDTLYTTNNWPVMSDYLSGDFSAEGVLKTYSFANKSETSTPATNVATTTCVLLNNDAIKDYHSVAESYNVEGVTYTLSATIYDPYSNLASYYPVTIKSLQKKVFFNNSSDEIGLISDPQGKIETPYYDIAFDKETININVSYRLNTITHTPDISNSEIDVKKTNEHNWLIRQIKGSYPGFTERGMALLTSSSQAFSLSYKPSFLGDNFIAKYVINLSQGTNGRYAFFVQQVDQNPVNWPSIASDVNYPVDQSTFGLSVSFYGQSFNTIRGGQAINQVKTSQVRAKYNYVWFDKRGNTLSIYSNTKDERPVDPISTVAIGDDVLDPNMPYWLGFSSDTNGGAVTASITALLFSSYNIE